LDSCCLMTASRVCSRSWMDEPHPPQIGRSYHVRFVGGHGWSELILLELDGRTKSIIRCLGKAVDGQNTSSSRWTVISLSFAQGHGWTDLILLALDGHTASNYIVLYSIPCSGNWSWRNEWTNHSLCWVLPSYKELRSLFGWLMCT